MQQQQERKIAKEVYKIPYTPANDPSEEEPMHEMAVNDLVIDSRLLCSANFTAKAAVSNHPVYKYAGPLRYDSENNTYEVLTQREAESYMEQGVELLHLSVHRTEDVTALLSVYNGILSLGEEDRRSFLIACKDEIALTTLRDVVVSRRLAASIPESHFGQALVSASMDPYLNAKDVSMPDRT